MIKRLLIDCIKAGYSADFSAKYINFFGYSFSPKDIKLMISRTRFCCNGVHSGVDFTQIKREQKQLKDAYRNYLESKAELKRQLKRSTGSEEIDYTHWL